MAGLTGFYTGVGPTVTRGAVLTATQLSSYDNLKHKILDWGYMEECKTLHFMCSMYAGVMCALATSPIDIVKTRLMNFKEGQTVYNGMIDCGVKIVKTEGFFGLYKGFTG